MSFLSPLGMFAVLYLVLAKFVREGGEIPHDPVYLLFGVVLWNYVGEVTGNAMGEDVPGFVERR